MYSLVIKGPNERAEKQKSDHSKLIIELTNHPGQSRHRPTCLSRPSHIWPRLARCLPRFPDINRDLSDQSRIDVHP